MENKYPGYLLAVFFVALMLLGSCKNQKNCKEVACEPPEFDVRLDYIDKQGRDLLNPATPGHFDTAKIKQLNPTVRVLYTAQLGPYTKRIELYVMYLAQHNATYIKLSDTDQDTIYAAKEYLKEGCCPGQRLTAFSYNGKVYADSVDQAYFTIIK